MADNTNSLTDAIEDVDLCRGWQHSLARIRKQVPQFGHLKTVETVRQGKCMKQNRGIKEVPEAGEENCDKQKESVK